MGLAGLVGPEPIGIDASVLIYWVEEAPGYVEQVEPLFEAAGSGRLELVTSAITLLEVLVVPLRASNAVLAARYESLLTRGRGLSLVDVDRQQLRVAAELRAKYGVRTPDALQLAAAVATGCPKFVTNDRRIPAVPGLDVVQLRDVA